MGGSGSILPATLGSKLPHFINPFSSLEPPENGAMRIDSAQDVLAKLDASYLQLAKKLDLSVDKLKAQMEEDVDPMSKLSWLDLRGILSKFRATSPQGHHEMMGLGMWNHPQHVLFRNSGNDLKSCTCCLGEGQTPARGIQITLRRFEINSKVLR